MHGITVAHPDGLAVRAAREHRAAGEHVDRRAAVLARTGLRDRPAERERHRLEPVADAEHRDPGVEQCGVDRRRALGVHARGTAREDDRGRVLREHLLDARGVRDDLGVHVRLAHAPRDELRVLRTEVHDQHRAVRRGLRGARGRRRGLRGGGHGLKDRCPTGHLRIARTHAAAARTICASASACTRRSSTNDITGTTPASTIAASRPSDQRIFDHRSITVARYTT